MKTIEGFGFSTGAYPAALDALENRYGGERRKASMFLDLVEKCSPIKNTTGAELERFSDMLNQLITNLKESNRYEEFGQGLLYRQLQKKFPNTLLTDYNRWIIQQQKTESVLTLQEFIDLERKCKVMADEATKSNATATKPMTYHGTTNTACTICNLQHDLNNCDRFKKMTHKERWAAAYKKNLCFQCLKKITSEEIAKQLKMHVKRVNAQRNKSTTSYFIMTRKAMISKAITQA